MVTFDVVGVVLESGEIRHYRNAFTTTEGQ
jgi:hypothetical protein